MDENDVPTGVANTYALSVVVTQDCDLEQDFAARFSTDPAGGSPDKLLFGILMCGVYEEERLMAGVHRTRAKQFGKREWKPVTLNQDPRYQYLGTVPPTGKRLVADFKDFFMVPCEFLYAELSAQRVTRVTDMTSPYKEHLLQRFAWYLMRVGLPIDFHNLGEKPVGEVS